MEKRLSLIHISSPGNRLLLKQCLFLLRMYEGTPIKSHIADANVTELVEGDKEQCDVLAVILDFKSDDCGTIGDYDGSELGCSFVLRREIGTRRAIR